MSWEDKLKERWYLYHYSADLDQFTTCGREIETFITSLLKERRDEITFDKLREYITEDEVDNFSLSVVINRVRKILRAEPE